MISELRIGTRGSRLALIQTSMVVDAINSISEDFNISILEIKSEGDLKPNENVSQLGLGVFTSELEKAVLEHRVDLAVHSLKDLPTIETKGLKTIIALKRADPRDVLINKWSKPLLDIPDGARIGTSSPRREAQLKHGRPTLKYLPIRGNVETRVKKALGNDYDGVVLAAAGLERLGMINEVTEFFSTKVLTPAPGQGAIAIQFRAEDLEKFKALENLSDKSTVASVTAERSLSKAAGSGCMVPIGAYAEVNNDNLNLFATVTALDGSQSYRVEVTGSANDPEIAGKAAFFELLDQGAGQLIDSNNL
ncbi:MAG: hydroxymethylbilane synthase [Dehalococcoidia bacterium]|nr:hydroxymethylbilane synthase [Dehalococcoidia bacterium]|tara:strand:- start:2032 stop:2952 length:921 start_codon:yes stop_codon:yes gene_type:complete